MDKEEIKKINIDDFDYPLPDDRIALYPLAERDKCKLLCVFDEGQPQDYLFTDLPRLLNSEAVLIYNNTKVINARIKFRKNQKTDGALIEIFCLEPIEPSDYARNFGSRNSCVWKCFVGNSKKWNEGTPLKRIIEIEDKTVTLTATRVGQENGSSQIKFEWNNDCLTFSDILDRIGEIPIPPYLKRATEKSDVNDYQTVFSKIEGSVAAPTAGLHFTENILKEIDNRNIPRRDLTLHVGAGTFKPVKSDEIGGHEMHEEFFSVSKKLIEEIISWKSEGRKIYAVGTTSVRTLESLYYAGFLVKNRSWAGIVPQWLPYDENVNVEVVDALSGLIKAGEGEDFIGETKLMIAPGYKFRIVDGIITNFHQPKSTLLLLISAFLDRNASAGKRWKRIYDHALEHDYRFLSYGDACFFTE
ncbi:MAG: S-adenosylmethionine:tRNA ribosyltransferase-isomerase [Muribaculaceae bacterium]|nr:S-adenosylmethionine:tRNA ribosyltransferase-isomerase [Muribaculaceae bacterium]